MGIIVNIKQRTMVSAEDMLNNNLKINYYHYTMENKRKVIVISVIDNSRNIIEYFLDIGLPIKQNFSDNIVVMSRLCWLFCKKRDCVPKNCIVYVMNENTENQENHGPQMGGLKEYYDIINIHKNKNVYIVGGEQLSSMFIPICDEVILNKLSFVKTGRYKKYKCLDDIYVISKNIRENTLCSEMTYTRENSYIHPELRHHDLIKKLVETQQSIYSEKIDYDLTKTFPLLTSKYTNHQRILDILLKILNGKIIVDNEPAMLWSKNIQDAVTKMREGDTNVLVPGIKNNIINPVCQNISCQFLKTDNELSVIVYVQIQNIISLNETLCFYSFLLHIVCKLLSDTCTPKKLTIFAGEIFIYNSKNEMSRLKNILCSSPKPFPVLKINKNFKSLQDFTLHGLN